VASNCIRKQLRGAIPVKKQSFGPCHRVYRSVRYGLQKSSVRSGISILFDGFQPYLKWTYLDRATYYISKITNSKMGEAQGISICLLSTFQILYRCSYASLLPLRLKYQQIKPHMGAEMSPRMASTIICFTEAVCWADMKEPSSLLKRRTS